MSMGKSRHNKRLYCAKACNALSSTATDGSAGVRPGEKVVRYEDTDEGSVIHEQQLAWQQHLEEVEQQQQERARRGEASILIPAGLSVSFLTPHTQALCASGTWRK